MIIRSNSLKRSKLNHESLNHSCPHIEDEKTTLSPSLDSNEVDITKNYLVNEFLRTTANKTLFNFLRKNGLSPASIDDPLFREFLSLSQMLGNNYIPTSKQVYQDISK